MKKIVMVMMMILGIGICQGYVLTFDDITTEPAGGVVIPDGYSGFEWNSVGDHRFGVVNGSSQPGSGFENGVVSGSYVAFNSYGNSSLILRDTAFDFEGAYLTAAWNDGLEITVDGYFNNFLEYTTTVIVDTTEPTWFDFDYMGIDKLEFTAFGGTDAGLGGSGTYFAMDNFSFVPEPGTIFLFALGGLIVKRLTKKRSTKR